MLDKEILEKEIRDKELVEIKESDRIKIDLYYYKKNYKNAVDKAYTRSQVYEKLLYALSFLPKEYSFKILDAWRPFELQEELYYAYSDEIVKNFQIENMAKEEQERFISQFVAYPSKDPNNPPAHTTGFAIDLTLIKASGEEVDVGVGFDEFSDKTFTNYYEVNSINDEIKNNRRILLYSMSKAGFTNIPSEIWHYNL